LLLIGAASGAGDPPRAAVGAAQSTTAQRDSGGVKNKRVQWKRVRGVVALEAELAAAEQAGKPVRARFLCRTGASRAK
jgi:hypothetical protein